jgi:class 3 adenylate cyclase/pimeloyl-ACP methyl ester carboxylesterase
MPSQPARIQFANTEDGVRIAFAEWEGEGPPLIWTPSWVSHIEMDWSNPDIAPLYERLAANHRFIHFDGRGTGLSDRDVGDLSAAARAKDLQAVVRAAGLETFDLFAWSQWGPPAIMYAASHLEQVRRLALYGTFATAFGGGDRRDLADALLALIRAEWSIGSRTIIEFVYPNIDHEHERIFAEYFRASASGKVAAAILEEGLFHANVAEHLPRLSMPTAVLHRQRDPAVGYEAGLRLASLVPGARFIPLSGDIHVPWHGDVDEFLEALESFLGVAPSPIRAGLPTYGAPLTVLFTDIEGSISLTERLGDEKAQDLLRNHNAIVRDALRRHGGSEIKHTGDGIMASFASASKALESAIAIQRALARHNQEHPDAPIHVRIGLNVGEPVAEEHDLFGTAVQLARRICDRAEPGQILASNVVRELVAGKGFLFSSQGEADLRGFEDPMRLYDVHWAE